MLRLANECCGSEHVLSDEEGSSRPLLGSDWFHSGGGLSVHPLGSRGGQAVSDCGCGNKGGAVTGYAAEDSAHGDNIRELGGGVSDALSLGEILLPGELGGGVRDCLIRGENRSRLPQAGLAT